MIFFPVGRQESASHTIHMPSGQWTWVLFGNFLSRNFFAYGFFTSFNEVKKEQRKNKLALPKSLWTLYGTII